MGVIVGVATTFSGDNPVIGFFFMLYTLRIKRNHKKIIKYRQLQRIKATKVSFKIFLPPGIITLLAQQLVCFSRTLLFATMLPSLL